MSVFVGENPPAAVAFGGRSAAAVDVKLATAAEGGENPEISDSSSSDLMSQSSSKKYKNNKLNIEEKNIHLLFDI